MDVNKQSDEMVKVKFRASLENYIVNAKTDEVVSGIREYIVENIYEVLFIKATATKTSICKSCGSEIDVSKGKCEYCGTPVTLKSSDWIVYNYKQIMGN